jgi:3D (Asp-Asp-Asp) domain-containing protein
MGWKMRIARKKSKVVIQVALLVFGIMDLNGVIEYLKVVPEKKVLVFYNAPIEATLAQAVEEQAPSSVMGLGEENAPQVNFWGLVKLDKVGIFTAYNTVPEQTDGSPCTAADGSDICEIGRCVVAQNGVPFGTRIEVEGIGVCEVKDRKASRYDETWIDISFDKDVKGALAFGKRTLQYRVID